MSWNGESFCPADQAWFWTERWQEMERELDKHVEWVERCDTSEDFLTALDKVERGR